MSPQFLSRFDAVVLLESLGEEALLQIFIERGATPACASRRPTSRAFGCRLEVTPEAALRASSREAARQPRLGARALKEVFRRVVSPLEFDPKAAAGPDGRRAGRRGDGPAALGRGRTESGAAAAAAGWDQSFPG